MTHDLERFLQPDEIAKISRLELRARRVVEGFVSGLHRSPYFGQSIEFVQHREYVPGDDTRRIDWKVWSRTDRYYLKQFEEDTNVRVVLLVDGSESMQFGSGAMTKFDYAQTVAAALAMLVVLFIAINELSSAWFGANRLESIPPRWPRGERPH